MSMKTSRVQKPQLRIVKPFGTTTVDKSNPQVTFRLPRAGVLDGQAMSFVFYALVDGDAANDDKFMNNISSIFEYMQIRVGSETVQDTRQIGHLKTIIDNFETGQSKLTTQAAILEGKPALASSGVAKRYAIKLLSNSFLDRMVPLFKLPQVELIFNLNTALAEYTQATTAATTVTLSSMVLHCPIYVDNVSMQPYNAGWTTFYKEYGWFVSKEIKNGDTAMSVHVPTSHQSLNGILFVMRNNSKVANATLANKYESLNLFNGLSKLRFEIDSERFPQEDIDCTDGKELFLHLLTYIDMNHKHDRSERYPVFFTSANWGSAEGATVVAYDFRSEPNLHGAGVQTAGKGTGCQIIGTCLATADTTLSGWLQYDCAFKVDAQGNIKWSK